MTLKVFINGHLGKMGKLTQEALKNKSFDIVGGASSTEELTQSLPTSQADCVIDFTEASSALNNAQTILKLGFPAIIGSSGIHPDNHPSLNALAKANNIGCWVVPNFSIGALLLMKFSEEASCFFKAIEITETHHCNKKDSPSGTALETVKRIRHQDKNMSIPIHSLRLPGAIAEQSVHLSNQGEILTLTHTCNHRDAFSPGIIYTCQNILTFTGLRVGLDCLLSEPLQTSLV
ncbi:MAG TPA: dihydrodipicolinate reductase C-terminal domain-containing protein [Gammaproteobacteria bacterium]|nr:dihydrodipicolinate reductase C-terminal domain-containing protein [Gammaproteobacteria bacterium]